MEKMSCGTMDTYHFDNEYDEAAVLVVSDGHFQCILRDVHFGLVRIGEGEVGEASPSTIFDVTLLKWADTLPLSAKVGVLARWGYRTDIRDPNHRYALYGCEPDGIEEAHTVMSGLEVATWSGDKLPIREGFVAIEVE